MTDTVIDWLLASDPAIRWQVMRDIMDAPETDWMAERRRVEDEGWGARLLALRDADGQWAGGAFMPRDFTHEDWKTEGQAWTATCFSLQQLREFGLDPASATARDVVEKIGRNSRWDHDGQPYWEGEVEECINARTVSDGVYFGVDVAPIVVRLLSERQDDGGWNCERANGSVRSSFDTTINVLEGLLAFEREVGGVAGVREARLAGQEYLLERHLFRRLSTGEAADERYLKLMHPNRWRHDILRALDYFRLASSHDNIGPYPRLGEAIAHLKSRRLPDGRWPLDWTLRGRVWFDLSP